MLRSIPLLLVLGIGTAGAQQLATGTSAAPTGAPAVGTGVGVGGSGAGAPPLSIGMPVAPPLTMDSALIVKQRLDTSLAQRQAMALSTNALREAGLSAENDAVEYATQTPAGKVAPAHVQLLRPAKSAPAGEVDPGLAYTTRLALRARLGRDPTAAELNAELRAFDTRIAKVNESLAALRPEIAPAVRKDGVFPRALEASILGVAPAARDPNSPAAREGLRALFQMLLTR